MSYLIDTDWVIDHLLGIPEATQFLTKLTQEAMAISIITYMEAFFTKRALTKAYPPFQQAPTGKHS